MFELSAYVHSRRLQRHGIVEETVTSIGPSMASICIHPSILGPCAIVVFIWCSLFVAIYMLLMTLEISGTASQQKNSLHFTYCYSFWVHLYTIVYYDIDIGVYYILFNMHFFPWKHIQEIAELKKLLQNFCGFFAAPSSAKKSGCFFCLPSY